MVKIWGKECGLTIDSQLKKLNVVFMYSDSVVIHVNTFS